MTVPPEVVESVETCAIIMIEANAIVKPVHVGSDANHGWQSGRDF
jgi:hypothetical protein